MKKKRLKIIDFHADCKEKCFNKLLCINYSVSPYKQIKKKDFVRKYFGTRFYRNFYYLWCNIRYIIANTTSS